MKIECRAWDKKNKQMVKIITLHHPDYLDFCEYATGQSSSDMHQLRYKNCTILMVSEFKDKDNKQICEGDIVTYVSAYKHKIERKTMAVIFRNGRFGLMSALKSKPVWDCQLRLYNTKEHEMKIIGNIYESPELLKVQK